MPKKKVERQTAATIRFESPLDSSNADLKRIGSLEVVQGAAADLGRQILCKHRIIIGRDQSADLALNDGSISRAHCAIEREPPLGTYVLTDLCSTNGTSHNGVPIKDKMLLSPGDKIFLGSSVVRFALSDQVDIDYHSKLEELVQLDALTGLSTKRQYDAVFEVMTERALAEKSDLTVLVMDMDGLKAINDTHGHEMGSFSITEVASLLQLHLGSMGHVARFGGDEFVACFQDLSAEQVHQSADKLRIAIEKHRFENNQIVIHPTISCGVANYPQNTQNPRELFNLADQSLYRAKRAGKNRVESA